MTCKQDIGTAILASHDKRTIARVLLHPKGCLSARQDHIDVLLERDPCGVKELLRRGGHCIRIIPQGEYMTIDLSTIMGYPCSIELPNPYGWRRVYLMLSRSGSLYVTRC